MTDSEILSIADEDGIDLLIEVNSDQLLAFARAIAAKEREECAELCENITDIDEDVDDYYSHIYATAIRARGE